MGFKPQLADLSLISLQEEIILGCIVAPVDEESRVLALLSTLKADSSFRSTVNPVFPDVRFINITALNISKGSAVSALIAHLGLKKEQVVAIGDADNDLALFEAAGLKIAMANASPRLKNCADFVTGDVDHNGVAQAISNIFSQ
jgi:hydroxymethylpyrimidine pyrophosphatase-like HAD family hydrolase